MKKDLCHNSMGSIDMTAICLPIPSTVAQEMVRGVIDAVCDRPGETAAQRDARARDVERSVLAFAPRDPVEFMLAGLAVAHYHLILDSMHDAFGEASRIAVGRTNSGVAGLDRAMTGLLRELRIAQKRPQEEAVAAEAPVEAPELERDVVAEAPVVAAKPVAVVMPRNAMPGTPVPLRATATSGAAMMAARSPPMKPVVVRARPEARAPNQGMVAAE